eukprot:gene31007-38883_t
MTAEELALVRLDVEQLAVFVEGEYTATAELALAHLPAQATFASGELATRLSEMDRRQLIEGVIDSVSNKYETMTSDLVSTVRKTESSLKRLKKGRKDSAPGSKETAAADAAVSDTDKICHQLLLDVQEYGRQLESLGFTPMEMHSYQQLWESVQEKNTAPQASMEPPTPEK